MSAQIDARALASTLARLERREQGEVLQHSIDTLLNACVDLFDCRGSGLMLADDQGQLHYVATTDTASRELERLQIEVGEGPCVDALAEGREVWTSDVTTDPRWPRLAPLLRSAPLRSVLGLPINLSDATIGSLDLWRDSVQPWHLTERTALAQFARVVEAMVGAAVNAERSGELAAQLNHALAYRIPIERGIGFLMARDGLSASEAFSLLRNQARSRRRRVVDIAAELLDSGRLPLEVAEEQR